MTFYSKAPLSKFQYLHNDVKYTFSQQTHASERGRSALFKNPLFFWGMLYWGSTKFFWGPYIFCPGLGAKKSPCSVGSKKLSSEAIFTKFSASMSLDKSVWWLYWGSTKSFWGVYIFCPRLGTKIDRCPK